jgi:hypothetical protein
MVESELGYSTDEISNLVSLGLQVRALGIMVRIIGSGKYDW